MIDLNPNDTYIEKYMVRIKETLHKSLREYHRTMVLRVDLRLPDNSPYAKDPTLITRFMESLKSQKNADQLKKISFRKRIHHCRIRYIWVREFNEKGKKHYHVALFLNKDAYAYPGSHKPDRSGRYRHNLSFMIMEAWIRTLYLNQEENYQKYYPLVSFPKNRYAYLDILSSTFLSDYKIVMNRLKYFAKERSKDYSDGQRNFGCSQH
ncbi:inovirus Gp2 family protein [Salmonella enterica]|nr:inovirus Gp2 family protein [Salmonella enterica]EIR1990613.1 inovirus Gp2 family protein [Salmonella enterica]MBA3114918.1 inovirus Gp2 family protein [Salmonella enterica]